MTLATPAPSTASADAPAPRAGAAGAPSPPQGRVQLAVPITVPLGLPAPAPAPATGEAPAAAATGAAPAAQGATPLSLAGAKAPATSLDSAAADSAGAVRLTHGGAADAGDANPDASAPPDDLAAAQAAAAPAPLAEPAAGGAPSVAVHTPVGASGWADEVGAQVIWMAHEGVTSASLRLHPEHLGPVEVKISVHEDNASVWFGASQPETRAALQQALPQLKDMFAAQGMTLTDAGVSREPPRDTQYAQRPAPSAAGASTDSENATAVSLATPRRGLVDTYA